MKNSVNIKFESQSVNESFARIAVSAFLAPLNPTINELADIKTAVSEAVTNAIVHGYRDTAGIIEMKINVDGEWVRIEIIDDGTGIEDVEKARQPFYTTCGDGTRSGMGFMVMESFMDELYVASAPDEGTRVVMRKRIRVK
jgi:anti-sigma F factor